MTESAGEAQPAWSRTLTVVSAVISPVALATALLVYFGWARADAQAQYMGLNASLFGYTPQDFILISINALFLPMIGILIAGIAWLALDRWLRARIEEGSMRAGIARMAGYAAAAGLAVALLMLLLALLAPQRTGLFAPYAMAASVLVTVWAIRLRRAARPDPGPVLSVEHRALEATLLLALVALLLFWGTADYAQALGRGLAVGMEQGVNSLPRAEVYSPKPLEIGVPEVKEVKLGPAEAPVYRYDGLRLLVLSGGRFFFLHDGWTVRTGTVVVLPDNNSVRIEFSR